MSSPLEYRTGDGRYGDVRTEKHHLGPFAPHCRAIRQFVDHPPAPTICVAYFRVIVVGDDPPARNFVLNHLRNPSVISRGVVIFI